MILFAALAYGSLRCETIAAGEGGGTYSSTHVWIQLVTSPAGCRGVYTLWCFAGTTAFSLSLLLSSTEYHIGQLKARLAKLRTQLLEPGGGGGAEAAGFEVSKSGDARVSLIGFPYVLFQGVCRPLAH